MNMDYRWWSFLPSQVQPFDGATMQTTALNRIEQGNNLKVAHTQNYVPYDFVDEEGESDGHEVAVLKAIDETTRLQVWVHWNK